MNIEIWKRIFEMSTNEVLLKIANTNKIKVPGFRELKLDKSFEIIRPQLIQLLTKNKNLLLIKITLNKMTEDDEELYQFRSKSLEELMKIMEEDVNPYNILVSLLSSESDEHKNLGEILYSRLIESGNLGEYDNKMLKIRKDRVKAKKQQFDEDIKAKETIEIEKKFQKSQNKIDNLTRLLREQKEEFQKQISEIKENEKKMKNENDLFRGNLKLAEISIEKKTNEMNVIESSLKAKDFLLYDKEEQIKGLMLRLDELQILNMKDQKENKNIMNSNNSMEVEPSTRVMVVGNPTNIIFGNCIEVLKTIESNDIEESMDQSLFVNIDEIWVLTFDIPLSKRRIFLNNVQHISVIEFTNTIQLQSYISKQRRVIS